MKRFSLLGAMCALILSVLAIPAVAQQSAGTTYSNFSAPFAAPALAGIGTSNLTYSAGTIYLGGLAKPITVGTLSSLDATKNDCSAPAFASCEFIYWTSGTALSKSATLATAAASGNIMVAYVTTDGSSNVLTITPISLDLSPIPPVPCPTGKLIFYADTGEPTVGSQGTNTTGVANQLWYTQITIPCNFTITNLSVLAGGTATTDKIALGLWSTSGTLLAWTSTTVGGGTLLSGANTFQTLALATPYAAAPGKYIVGVVTSGTTAGDIQTAPLLGPVAATASSQGTLASFTPVTTSTTNNAPFMWAN